MDCMSIYIQIKRFRKVLTVFCISIGEIVNAWNREKCVEFYVLLICLRIKEEAQAKHNTSIQQFFQIFPSDICKNLLQRPNCKIWFCNLQAIKNFVGWTKRTVPFQMFYNFWCNF